MTTIQRRIFLFFFVLLFLLTAPVIVLFATGYRFDQTGNIFVHSGSITIESWPRDIEVYLNGEKQKNKTLNNINNAYTINGLRPGHYQLSCKKDGFTTWEKTIDVHSGISTEFWNVLLFPHNMPKTLIYDTPSIKQFFLSPRNNDEIVFFSEENNLKKVSLLNIKDNLPEEIFQTDTLEFMEQGAKENVEWSSDNKQILIPFQQKGAKVYVIARIQKDQLRNIINLNELIDDPTIELEKARWMFDKNDELVLLTKDRKLYYFFLDQPKEKILLAENVSGFNFAGNRIYYTQLPNNIVWEIKDYDLSTKRQITNLSIANNNESFVELTVYNEYEIAIIDGTKTLYVFNEEKEKGEKSLSEINKNVQGIQFSDDGKKLLYWTDNEIWTLMLRDWEVQPLRTKNSRILITRFSRPVYNVQWMDNYENILFSVDNEFKSAELDNRDHINIVDVVKSTFNLTDRDAFYNKNNQTLFLKNKFNDSDKLQSYLLIDKTSFLGF